MLRASKTAGGYSQLLTMWAKTLPTGQQVKANSNFGDDGRQQLDMLDEFMESFDNESGPTEQWGMSEGLERNAEFRRAIVLRAQADNEFRRQVWIRCARDIVFFCDTFGWTYNPKDYENAPNRPFILHECQEHAFHVLDRSIGRADALIAKSRTMGASFCLIALEHKWQFKSRQSFPHR